MTGEGAGERRRGGVAGGKREEGDVKRGEQSEIRE